MNFKTEKKFMLLLTLLSVIFVVACSSGELIEETETEAGEGENEATLLRMNMVIAESEDSYAVWEQYAEDLEEASEGTLEVEVYPSEQLGNAADVIEQISQGAPIMMHSDPSQYGEYVDDYSIYMHPYLLKEPDDIDTLWKSDLGQRLDSELQEKGLRVSALGYFGTRHLIANQEVTTRDDAQNLQFRNAPTKMWDQVTYVLGGSPVHTAWSEVYTAVSQGVIDGAENPVSGIYSSKIYEAAPHLNLTGHLTATNGMVMSEEVYQSLDPKAQTAIDEVGSEFPPKLRDVMFESEENYLELLKEEGTEVHEVDLESFESAAENISDDFPEWTPGLYEEVLEIIE
ncbi:TRAP transporter substrate-binding protein DctP [Salinicoccus sp. Marseille-QA3877]